MAPAGVEAAAVLVDAAGSVDSRKRARGGGDSDPGADALPPPHHRVPAAPGALVRDLRQSIELLLPRPAAAQGGAAGGAAGAPCSSGLSAADSSFLGAWSEGAHSGSRAGVEACNAAASHRGRTALAAGAPGEPAAQGEPGASQPFSTPAPPAGALHVDGACSSSRSSSSSSSARAAAKQAPLLTCEPLQAHAAQAGDAGSAACAQLEPAHAPQPSAPLADSGSGSGHLGANGEDEAWQQLR
jgi:hypothetical protein